MNTIWLVGYYPYLARDFDDPRSEEREIPCFRIFPEDDPKRWIAQTNEGLPADVQEHAALLMAAALNRVFG